ncbi:hypothetical protein ACWATR_25400 [Nostoc sp. UIC 10890]
MSKILLITVEGSHQTIINARALELLAQIRLLKSYGIRTGDIDIQKLPESLQN